MGRCRCERAPRHPLDAALHGAPHPPTTRGRRTALSLLYGNHLAADAYERHATWMQAADDRLARISTRSRVLRKGRAARRALTALIRGLRAAAPSDFCATVTAWQGRGFKGTPPEWDAFVEVVTGFDDAYERCLARAGRLLKRSGATRAQRDAFGGGADWPEFREPAPDVVAEALGETPEANSGSRTPW